MDQDACLQSPHHFTHLGVCYVGSNVSLGISNPDHPQPVVMHVGVPEPDPLALLAIGWVILLVKLWRYRP